MYTLKLTAVFSSVSQPEKSFLSNQYIQGGVSSRAAHLSRDWAPVGQ